MPTAPQILTEPETILAFSLSAGEWNQSLELGIDRSASTSLDQFDRALPPVGPANVDYQAHLVGDEFRFSRDVRPISEKEVNWRMRVSSIQPVRLKVDSHQIPKGKELVIVDSLVETVLTANTEVELSSGNRELTVSLRPLPKSTQLLQNYPNPFNPETWIPYQLHQESLVQLSIYSSDGEMVREIDLGLKPAGNYQTAARAIYWDGNNESGEQVSSGIYFYQIKTADYQQIRKMVILK